MSALPPIADIDTQRRDVRFVPLATKLHCKKYALFDHLVGGRKQPAWNFQSESLSRLEVDNHFKFCR
jgi:hypothetical protein